VLDAFTKHEKVAQEIADEKKRKYDEIDRKRKEKVQAEKLMEQKVLIRFSSTFHVDLVLSFKHIFRQANLILWRLLMRKPIRL